MSVNLRSISKIVADYLNDEPYHCQLGKQNRVLVALCNSQGEKVPSSCILGEETIGIASQQLNKNLIDSLNSVKELNKSYRRTMQEQIIFAARPILERIADRKPRVLFFGPSELEKAPIKKLAEKFDVTLVGEAIPFLKNLYKDIPNISFVKRDLSGGMNEALSLITVEAAMLEQEANLSHSKVCKKLIEAQKLLIEIDRTFATGPDLEEITFLGGPADYVVSYNVASQLGPAITTDFQTTLENLAQVHDRMPRTDPCEAKTLVKTCQAAQLSLDQKCIVKHLNCLKACTQDKGTVLFADTLQGQFRKIHNRNDVKNVKVWSDDSLQQISSLFNVVKKQQIIWYNQQSGLKENPERGLSWDVSLFELQPKASD